MRPLTLQPEAYAAAAKDVMTTDQIPVARSRAEARAPESRRRGLLLFARDVIVIILIAVLASFLVKTFLVRSFYIPSKSMEMTLLVDDRILVDEITPRFGGYDRGDIVVFRDPGGWLPDTPTVPRPWLVEAGDWLLSLVGLSAPDSDDHLIKRIIGLPGDRVVCCNELGQITINGVAIDETAYLELPSPDAEASGDEFDEIVPADSLWVLGDNRYQSKDSRYNTDKPTGGFVPISNVVGRAFIVTWPFDRFGWLDFHHGVFASVPEPADAPEPTTAPAS